MLTHTHVGVQTLLGACVPVGHLHLDQVRDFSEPCPHLSATALLAPQGENGGTSSLLAEMLRPCSWGDGTVQPFPPSSPVSFIAGFQRTRSGPGLLIPSTRHSASMAQIMLLCQH